MRYCWTKGVYVEELRKQAVEIRDYIYKNYGYEQIKDFDNSTLFAEDVAYEMEHPEWLDDDTNMLWDVVSDIRAKLKIED